MPNAKRTKKASDTSKPAANSRYNRKLEWVNPFINEVDKKWLENHSDDLPILICEFLESLGEDDTISIKFHGDSGRFMATLIPISDTSPNEGCALSVRAATPPDALFLLGYCHLVKYETVWGVSGAEDKGRWG